jgi:hypothetical protein
MHSALWLSKQGQARLSGLPTMPATVTHMMATKVGKFQSASSLKLSEAENEAKLLQMKMKVLQFNASEHINSKYFQNET